MRPRRDHLCAAAMAAAVLCSACSGERVVMKSDLPITDDFSQGCSWAADDDAVSRTRCSGGQYEVLVRRPQVRPHHVIPRRFDEVPGVTVSADVTLARYPAKGFAAMGLGCWSSPHGAPGQGYVFSLAVDGSAAIFRDDERDASLRRHLYLKMLDQSPPVSGFDPSVPTRIWASCTADAGTVKLEMRMGQRRLSATDLVPPRPFQAAGFDVLTEVANTQVDFDNVTIRSAGRS